MYKALIPTMMPVVVKTTLLLIAGFAAAGILRNKPASHRAAIWQAALLAAVLLPALNLLLPACGGSQFLRPPIRRFFRSPLWHPPEPGLGPRRPGYWFHSGQSESW